MKRLKFNERMSRSLVPLALLAFSYAGHSIAGSATYTSSDTFNVPAGVSSVRVLVIGGGGAGAGSHWPAGGSGYLNAGTLAVTPGTLITINVGAGGATAGCAGNSCIGSDGGVSSFGALLQADGGIRGDYQGRTANGANGGSGGGGAGNSGFGGAGGTGGSDGVDGDDYDGGVGQGTAVWSAYFAIFTETTITAGAGGIPSTGTHQGGGGGGGILLNGSGPSGANGGSTAGHTGGFGGSGYGAGGGSGGYNSGDGYAVGGSGADGLVYVEWDDDIAAPPQPIPTMSVWGLVMLTGLMVLTGFSIRRRT